MPDCHVARAPDQGRREAELRSDAKEWSERGIVGFPHAERRRDEHRSAAQDFKQALNGDRGRKRNRSAGKAQDRKQPHVACHPAREVQEHAQKKPPRLSIDVIERCRKRFGATRGGRQEEIGKRAGDTAAAFLQGDEQNRGGYEKCSAVPNTSGQI